MIEMPAMRMRRKDKRAWFAGFFVFVAVFLFTFLTGYFKHSDMEVEAASLDEFDAGYIISDWQMGRYDAMSEAEIQEWLTMMNSCGNTDYDYYLRLSGGSVYKWHFKEGHFVCLSEELFGDGEVIGEGETAAHIIWQAAQDYKINPQVLLVLLQKETGLITDPIPNDGDYRKATGYGCPDTAACSSKYYGFENQIRNAAALFRTVLDGGWTNYPLGENYIQYNPSYECGGSVVNIRSLATSALYRYTPYQPNEGALAAGRGTAYCGAYGNRNFYLYFEDWFGGITNDSGEKDVKETDFTADKLSIEELKAEMVFAEEEQNDLAFSYDALIEEYGWMGAVDGGQMIGTTGFALRMEAIKISLVGVSGIEYRTHVQGAGWENEYKKDGEISGNENDSRRIEAIQIRLSEKLARKYDIYYRAHVENIGWMDWVKNGEMAGTTGQSLRMEAIEIKLLEK